MLRSKSISRLLRGQCLCSKTCSFTIVNRRRIIWRRFWTARSKFCCSTRCIFSSHTRSLGFLLFTNATLRLYIRRNRGLARGFISCGLRCGLSSCRIRLLGLTSGIDTDAFGRWRIYLRILPSTYWWLNLTATLSSTTCTLLSSKSISSLLSRKPSCFRGSLLRSALRRHGICSTRSSVGFCLLSRNLRSALRR